eukprot:1818800-Rhodomonas_salina.1
MRERSVPHTAEETGNERRCAWKCVCVHNLHTHSLSSGPSVSDHAARGLRSEIEAERRMQEETEGRARAWEERESRDAQLVVEERLERRVGAEQDGDELRSPPQKSAATTPSDVTHAHRTRLWMSDTLTAQPSRHHTQCTTHPFGRHTLPPQNAPDVNSQCI